MFLWSSCSWCNILLQSAVYVGLWIWPILSLKARIAKGSALDYVTYVCLPSSCSLCYAFNRVCRPWILSCLVFAGAYSLRVYFSCPFNFIMLCTYVLPVGNRILYYNKPCVLVQSRDHPRLLEELFSFNIL